MLYDHQALILTFFRLETAIQSTQGMKWTLIIITEIIRNHDFSLFFTQ